LNIGCICPCHFSLSSLFPPHPKQLQKVSLFYIIYVYKAHWPYSSFFISIHPPLPRNTPPPQDLFYQPVHHFLIPRSVYKGVSWCISAVNMLYLVSSVPSITLPYPFLPTPYYSTPFSTNRCPLPAQMQCIWILLTLCYSLFFPSSPEFLRVVALLHVLHINVYMIMFVFVYMFIFWTYFPHGTLELLLGNQAWFSKAGGRSENTGALFIYT
jgi:hypothetical protein